MEIDVSILSHVQSEDVTRTRQDEVSGLCMVVDSRRFDLVLVAGPDQLEGYQENQEDAVHVRGRRRGLRHATRRVISLEAQGRGKKVGSWDVPATDVPLQSSTVGAPHGRRLVIPAILEQVVPYSQIVGARHVELPLAAGVVVARGSRAERLLSAVVGYLHAAASYHCSSSTFSLLLAGGAAIGAGLSMLTRWVVLQIPCIARSSTSDGFIAVMVVVVVL